MDPARFAEEIQRLASGLAQDVLDELETVRLERRALQTWVTKLAKLLDVNPDQYRSYDSLCSECYTRIIQIIQIARRAGYGGSRFL